MKNTFLKSDLVKILILTTVFVVSIILLTIWNNNSGILEQLASKWL